MSIGIVLSFDGLNAFITALIVNDVNLVVIRIEVIINLQCNGSVTLFEIMIVFFPIIICVCFLIDIGKIQT